jgi:hypothetical protein
VEATEQAVTEEATTKINPAPTKPRAAAKPKTAPAPTKAKAPPVAKKPAATPKAKVPEPVQAKPKANAYIEAEDTLLLSLVAEHGRAAGIRAFVEQSGRRTRYSVECRYVRLRKAAAA